VFIGKILEPFGADAAGGKEGFVGKVAISLGIDDALADVFLDDEIFDFSLGDESYSSLLKMGLEFGNNALEIIGAGVLGSANDELEVGAFGFIDEFGDFLGVFGIEIGFDTEILEGGFDLIEELLIFGRGD